MNLSSCLITLLPGLVAAAANHSVLLPSWHTSVSNSKPRQITPNALVSDACVTYSDLEHLNQYIKPAVEDLTRNTDFFSHYRLNLFGKTCPFWNDDSGMCGNIACAVHTIDDEEDLPLVWRAEELSKLEGPKAKHPGRKQQKERPKRPLQGSLGEEVGESCVVEYDDECDERDYCVPDDEDATHKGDYVSLTQNPERYTGYAGDSSRMVWDAIYSHNCFKKSSFPHSAGLGTSPAAKGPAEQDFKAVLQEAGRQQLLGAQPSQAKIPSGTGLEFEDECLEKRVFYRVVSGMHASISTHICWDYLNKTTGEWEHNLNCFIYRVHNHPERVANMYFDYALVTRAISKIGPHLQDYTFCTGDPEQDETTKAKVAAVIEAARQQPEIFDESLMFKNGEGPSLKQEFKDNFRNISRIMDCTVCDKCRLWGKLQVAGYGAALKVLFEFDNDSGEIPELKRTELVALFNLYARLSSSIHAATEFRAMIDAQEAQELLDQQKSKGEEDVPSGDEWESADDGSHGNADSEPINPVTAEIGRVVEAFKYIVGSFYRFPQFW